MRCLALSALFVCLAIAGQCQIAAGYKSEISITPDPLDVVEATTKKGGWFGGFKKFFGSSETTTSTTTSTTTTTTTARPLVVAPPAQKPPPLVISHAPLMPLGPRPDTPSSSPFGSSPVHGPQWPAAAGTAGSAGGSAAAGAAPQWPAAAGAAAHPPAVPAPLPTAATSTQHTRTQAGAATATPNLPPGFAPYRPQKPQPSPFDLSYSGGAGQAQRPGFGLAPLTSSTTTSTTTTTTTTTTQRPRQNAAPAAAPAGGVDLRFGGSGSSTTSTVVPHAPSKDAFPTLPAPRRPSLKEEYPALPTPRSPGASTPNTPSSPSAWQSPLPTPVLPAARPTPASSSTTTTTTNSGFGSSTSFGSGGHSGVSFVPHKSDATTTVRPGFQSSGNSLATDDEIRQLTEQLYTKETNSQLSNIYVNLQGRTRSIDSADEAPDSLLTVNAKALEPLTIAKMRLLFNNYEQDTAVNEHVTANERREENEFLDAVMATGVMRQAMLFLQQKGLVTPDPKTHRDLVKELWFTQYSRGMGKIGSSGFEHVFVHEVKNGTIIGFHNWVYVNEEEQAGRFDYKGYMKEQDIGTKGKVLKIRFAHQGLNKPVDTMFVGTSPELELALYTVCFQLRPDRTCPVSLGNSRFGIVTYSWRYRGKSLIGSAYPEI
ncbi:hypothetical protein KR222_007663 [Zaprionus bogoriensis]|nr:hypothetical protein KR222_007663 [Zaprionus bogoriensis]